MNRTETRNHGYPIIDARQIGFSEQRIIIADRGPDAPHRYAVWREDETGNTEGGNYTNDLGQAVQIMKERARW